MNNYKGETSPNIKPLHILYICFSMKKSIAP